MTIIDVCYVWHTPPALDVSSKLHSLFQFLFNIDESKLLYECLMSLSYYGASVSIAVRCKRVQWQYGASVSIAVRCKRVNGSTVQACSKAWYSFYGGEGSHFRCEILLFMGLGRLCRLTIIWGRCLLILLTFLVLPSLVASMSDGFSDGRLGSIYCHVPSCLVRYWMTWSHFSQSLGPLRMTETFWVEALAEDMLTVELLVRTTRA